MFQTNFVEKIKTHISCSKSFPGGRSVNETIWKIFCTAGREADDYTKGRMRFAYWIKWIKTHIQTT
jgi:hypothetical protein